MKNEIATTEFQGFFAEFFDLLHQDCQDALMYPKLLASYGKRILELGSGTGRIAVSLANAGYQVTGIEYEQDMIDLALMKAYPRENLTIIRGDAREFSLDRSFDAILLSCNFANHFIDSGELLSVLLCCTRHLAEDGVVVMDCAIPDYGYMRESNGKMAVLEFHTERGTVIKDFFTSAFDFVRQIETDRIVLEEYKDDTLLRRAEVKEQLTWYNVREIRSLIREAGLTVKKQITDWELTDANGSDDMDASNLIPIAGKRRGMPV